MTVDNACVLGKVVKYLGYLNTKYEARQFSPILAIPHLGGRCGDLCQLCLEGDHSPHLTLHVCPVYLRCSVVQCN